MNNRRQFERVPLGQAVEYSQGEGSSVIGSLGNDISQSGVQIRVQNFIPLRSIVDLTVHLNNPVRAVAVKGQVMWVREVPYSDAYDIGIHFVNEGSLKSPFSDYVRTRRFEQ